MVELRGTHGVRLGRTRLLAALGICSLWLGAFGAPGRAAPAGGLALLQRASHAAEPRASRSQSRTVVRCLRRSGLPHSTVNATFLWVGWANGVAGFIYVQLYPSRSAALKEARFLKAEESGVAGRLVISQHVAPYAGSPVPHVVRCLHGKMISKPPHKRKQTFTF